MTKRRAPLSPQKAARLFVALVAARTVDDYLNLIDPTDASHQEIRATFAILESAVRRAERVRHRDISWYERNVENAVPKKYRPAIRRALGRLSNAESELLIVRERCAYLIGREVGRRIR